MRRLIIPVLLLGLIQVGHAQAASDPPPSWSAELKSYGWAPPKSPSNKAFFKDFSIAKLEASDQNTRVSFLNGDVVVAYHTKQEGQDWRTASRHLEAFFISTKDGSLLSRKEWETVVRGSESDLRDSESRLIPLSNGRFLVFASRAMMLYVSGLELIKQEKLDPSTSADLWSAQSVAGGHEIFLRHQSSSDQQTTYYWLASDTLLPLSQMPGFRGANFSVVAIAGDDSVLTSLGFSKPGITTGLGRIGLDGSTKIICSDQLCREDGMAAVVSPRRIAISGMRGIGVVDPEQGLLWSKQIPSKSNANDFQFGQIRTAMSANEFAVWITAYHKTLFDGVQVNSHPTLFLYDATNPKLLFTVPVKQKSGDFDFALSPDGSQLAIFDGAGIRLYAIRRG
jgi:hypothetical protein